MVSGWPAYLTRHADCFSSAVRVSRGLEGDVLLAQLVLHVALGEVGVAGHDESEHEQETGECEPADAEEDIEGSAFHLLLLLGAAVTGIAATAETRRSW